MMNKENDNTNKDNKWNDVTDENKKKYLHICSIYKDKKEGECKQ